MSSVYFNYWHLEKEKEEQQGLKEDHKNPNQEHSRQGRIGMTSNGSLKFNS